MQATYVSEVVLFLKKYLLSDLLLHVIEVWDTTHHTFIFH